MKKKILVVDNNPIMLKFMNDSLSTEGHEVLTAEDGLSALGILKTFTPDVIFTDLIMPNIEGEKLCQIIRKMPKLKNTFLVVLSAIAAEEKTDRAKLRADAYIAKGPMTEMRQHIFAALNQSERRPAGDLREKILGLENIFPREATRELLSTKRHFQTILGIMSEGILEVTSDKRIVYANPAAISLVGVPEEKLLGMEVLEVFNSPDRDRVEKLMKETGTKPQTIGEDSPVKLNSRLISMDITAIADEEDRHIIILKDITDRKQAEAALQEANRQLQRLTIIDGLTGIANRRHFDQVLKTEWRRNLRNQRPISLIMSDIDFFKNYNDHYGHLKGDDCLKQVAAMLNTVARRPGDLVARYGGEEFAIILSDTASENALKLAEKVRANIESLKIPHDFSPISDYLTLSGGIASVIPTSGLSPQKLIDAADKSLYKAKHEGRNRVAILGEQRDGDIIEEEGSRTKRG